jgi:DNA-binding NarL/FixJ family response regulator
LNQSENLWEDDSDKLLLLSKKQTKVLSLIAQGYTAKECADKLHLSPRTIESHKYRMLGLMNLNNHNELVQFALRNGLGITENRDATR